MKDYGRMQIMRMSDEELERLLREEGRDLGEGVAAMIFEELRNRKQQPAQVDLGISEEELEELNAEAGDEENEDETEDGTEASDDDDIEDETKDGDLEKRIDEQNKENKKILVVSIVLACAVAAIAILVLLILKWTGSL